jgi:hypothetical protein
MARAMDEDIELSVAWRHYLHDHVEINTLRPAGHDAPRRRIVGSEAVNDTTRPILASEDFAYSWWNTLAPSFSSAMETALCSTLPLSTSWMPPISYLCRLAEEATERAQIFSCGTDNRKK